MERTIKESDWKLLSGLRTVALERFSERVLLEMTALASDKSRTSHERYKAVFKLMQDRDNHLAGAFDDMRRSTAFFKLAAIHHLRLLTEEEMEQFTPETREIIRMLTGGEHT